MEDFFSLDDDKPVSDEESSSLHRNCLKELALEQMQYSDDSDAGSDISEDLPEGTDWNSLPAVHKKHDRNVNEDPPMITPRDHVERPRSARTAAGVRFATDEQILEKHTENFDSIRPRTAASRGAGLERSTKEAKMFAFTAEGHMSDWQTATAHAVETAAGAPDSFPTPNFVRKANEARSRPPDVVPPLNLAAIHHPVAKAPDAPSARHAVSSSARSSSFTPRDSERSRPRQRDQQTNSQDFLDSYRQDLVAVFMGTAARRVAKIPVKKKKIKKQAAVMQRVEAPAADTRASEPCLGSTLRSIGRDTSAYTASPVAAVAESLSSPQSEIDDVSAQPSSAGNDDGPGNHAHLSNEADAPSPRSPHQAALHDVTRVRASTANIIEQAALSGIEEFADAEERIDAIVSRAQVSSSPGKRGGRAVEDEGAPKVAAASSQKAHMLPYLQSGRKPKLTPRGGGGEFGEVDWQLLYDQSDGLVLTDLMSFSISDSAESSNKALLLCKLLHIPKAFTAQVLRASASQHGLNTLDNCRQLLCSAFHKVLEREALLQHIHVKQGLGAPTYQDIVCLGRISAVVAVKLKELRRSMFWIGHSSCRCFVWGKQDYEMKMAHDMEDVQLRF